MASIVESASAAAPPLGPQVPEPALAARFAADDGGHDERVNNATTSTRSPSSSPMTLTQSLPGPGQPSRASHDGITSLTAVAISTSPPPSSSSSRGPRFNTLARSSPSLAYPDDQPFSTKTRTVKTHSHSRSTQSALHSLQAAAGASAPGSTAGHQQHQQQDRHHQPFGISSSAWSMSTGASSGSASASSSSPPLAPLTRVDTLGGTVPSPTKRRPSISTPVTPAGDVTGLTRSRSYLGTSPTTGSRSKRVGPRAVDHFTSLDEAAALSATTFQPPSSSSATSPFHTAMTRSQTYSPSTRASLVSSAALSASTPTATPTSMQSLPPPTPLTVPRLRTPISATSSTMTPTTHLGAAQMDAKVVILGAQGVGKTSLVHRYTSGQFTASSVPSTIGASFLTKKLVIDDVKCRLQIWDTAGQERFRSMAPMYYRGSHAAIIVYDVTCYESFADVQTWIEELRRNMGGDLVIHIVGSKADLAPFAREVDRDQAYEQVLRWIYPERELAALAAAEAHSSSANAGDQSIASTASAGAATSSSAASTTTSRLGALGNLAMGSASRLAVAFPTASSRGNTLTRSGSGGGPPATAAAGGSGSTGSGGSDSGGAAGVSDVPLSSATVANVSLPGDDSDVELTEVSAKDGEGIEDVFVAITQRLVLQRAAIEQQRQERERHSIFLGGGGDGSGDDWPEMGQREAGKTPAQRWACCAT